MPVPTYNHQPFQNYSLPNSNPTRLPNDCRNLELQTNFTGHESRTHGPSHTGMDESAMDRSLYTNQNHYLSPAAPSSYSVVSNATPHNHYSSASLAELSGYAYLDESSGEFINFNYPNGSSQATHPAQNAGFSAPQQVNHGLGSGNLQVQSGQRRSTSYQSSQHSPTPIDLQSVSNTPRSAVQYSNNLPSISSSQRSIRQTAGHVPSTTHRSVPSLAHQTQSVQGVTTSEQTVVIPALQTQISAPFPQTSRSSGQPSRHGDTAPQQATGKQARLRRTTKTTPSQASTTPTATQLSTQPTAAQASTTSTAAQATTRLPAAPATQATTRPPAARTTKTTPSQASTTPTAAQLSTTQPTAAQALTTSTAAQATTRLPAAPATQATTRPPAAQPSTTVLPPPPDPCQAPQSVPPQRSENLQSSSSIQPQPPRKHQPHAAYRSHSDVENEDDHWETDFENEGDELVEREVDKGQANKKRPPRPMMSSEEVEKLDRLDLDELRGKAAKKGKYKKLTALIRTELDELYRDYQVKLHKVAIKHLTKPEPISNYVGNGNRYRGPTNYNNFCKYDVEARKAYYDKTKTIAARRKECSRLWRLLNPETQEKFNNAEFLATLPNPFGRNLSVDKGSLAVDQTAGGSRPPIRSLRPKGMRAAREFEATDWFKKVVLDVESFIVMMPSRKSKKNTVVLLGGSKIGDKFLDMYAETWDPCGTFADFVKGYDAVEKASGSKPDALAKPRKPRKGKKDEPDCAAHNKGKKTDNSKAVREKLRLMLTTHGKWQGGWPGKDTISSLKQAGVTLYVKQPDEKQISPMDFCGSMKYKWNGDFQRMLWALEGGLVRLDGPSAVVGLDEVGFNGIDEPGSNGPTNTNNNNNGTLSPSKNTATSAVKRTAPKKPATLAKGTSEKTSAARQEGKVKDPRAIATIRRPRKRKRRTSSNGSADESPATTPTESSSESSEYSSGSSIEESSNDDDNESLATFKRRFRNRS
ncbi:hypothetical protein PGT21_007296 [Puccinia graminis f. sp. tritici]|uniref:Uncharacterized protein n=1 Tax=Puccinia graminis f. sp. tritici TaxID=56615 RepID=A0A5B0P1R6_PUCGR|nr:hypothetical protein PGT21_007296 [Puccinia graminis f. sp. tritici]